MSNYNIKPITIQCIILLYENGHTLYPITLSKHMFIFVCCWPSQVCVCGVCMCVRACEYRGVHVLRESGWLTPLECGADSVCLSATDMLTLWTHSHCSTLSGGWPVASCWISGWTLGILREQNSRKFWCVALFLSMLYSPAVNTTCFMF